MVKIFLFAFVLSLAQVANALDPAVLDKVTVIEQDPNLFFCL